MADGDEAYGDVAAVTPTARSTAQGLAVEAEAGGTTYSNSGVAFMAGFARSLFPRLGPTSGRTFGEGEPARVRSL